jgi:hypothetical protein
MTIIYKSAVVAIAAMHAQNSSAEGLSLPQTRDVNA